jgi:prolyl oligopeptidase
MRTALSARARAAAPAPLALLALACSSARSDLRAAAGAPEGLAYPEPPRVEQVDDYHGTAVADPWRVLEDPADPRTKAWVAAQAELAERWLAALPGRAEILARLERLEDHVRWSAPIERGGRLFYHRQDGLAPQPVVCVAGPDGSEERVLLDPNQLSADGTVAIASFEPSPDGELVAYALSDGGSDWVTLRVREVESGRDLEDHVEWVKFSGAAWLPDGSGFFYARYPEPDARLESENRDQRVHLHVLGRPQEEDALVLARPDRPEWSFGLETTHDGELLLVRVRHGTRRENELWGLRLDCPDARVEPLRTGFDAAWEPIEKRGSQLFVLTDQGAPRGRVVALDLAAPDAAPLEVVPEGEARLESVVLAGERLVCLRLVDATSRLALVALDGRPAGESALPGLGTVRELRADPGGSRAFFTWTSFTAPPEVLALDATSSATTSFRRAEVDFDAERYAVRQVFARSRDGTRVPLFVVQPAERAQGGDAPTLLYGYGGFDVPVTPSFSALSAAWLELGGTWAVAVLRGGGEYGRDWYEAGTLERKTNVFEDFAACAEWLIEHGLTRPSRLAIHGRSNGGLLVGATLLRRPDLFGAALPAVGVLDMLRYHRFTIGWAWAGDYGTADDPDAFRWLAGYSPVHNVRPGIWPPTLITTADHDDRVVPMHSYKFAAALQEAQRGQAPILLRVDRRAGHGAGKPTAMRLAEAADQLAFLARVLGVEGAPRAD